MDEHFTSWLMDMKDRFTAQKDYFKRAAKRLPESELVD
jgi:hypothetical protein